jgi:CDP-diacylglycerol--glycerol-3-phosphate 3-phosphatidyltransferase
MPEVPALSGIPRRRSLPWALIGFRAAASPVLLLDAVDGSTSGFFLPLFLAAFLSDVFDGILARRWGVQTPAMRSADSFADVALYGSVAASAWLAKRAALEPFIVPALAVIGLQVLAWLLDLAKYRRLSSYHCWSAMAWGVAQAAAAVALFGFDRTGAWLWTAIGMGALNNLECLAITWILPVWIHDVPSLVHARRIALTLQAEGRSRSASPEGSL